MTLVGDARQRLSDMQTSGAPVRTWPEGCYGSAAGLLVFVGPSPGGSEPNPSLPPRPRSTGLALWNQSFTEPYDSSPGHWGGRYTKAIPILVEALVGLRLHEGSDKLYAFANFDSLHCPQEQHVSPTRMKAGEDGVVHVLSECRARIIAPLTKGAYTRLHASLEAHRYKMRAFTYEVMIPICDGRYHRRLDTLLVEGTGVLAGSVIIRCPQHPNRMLNEAHMSACAKEMRRAFDNTIAQKQR